MSKNQPKGGRKASKRTIANAINSPPAKKKPTRLDLLVQLMRRNAGATLAQLSKATGWQQHSVRGALAGAIKRKGLSVQSDKVNGQRRYRIEPES